MGATRSIAIDGALSRHQHQRERGALVLSVLPLGPDEAAAKRALGKARRASGQVVVLVPSPARFAPAAKTPAGETVRAVYARDARMRFEAARRVLIRHGVSVVEVGPNDTPATLFGRTGAVRRRVA